ncbi:MAG TPA: hypothetical protein VII58_05680 [Acidobacteriaceae bacterium]
MSRFDTNRQHKEDQELGESGELDDRGNTDLPADHKQDQHHGEPLPPRATETFKTGKQSEVLTRRADLLAEVTVPLETGNDKKAGNQ